MTYLKYLRRALIIYNICHMYLQLHPPINATPWLDRAALKQYFATFKTRYFGWHIWNIWEGLLYVIFVICTAPTYQCNSLAGQSYQKNTFALSNRKYIGLFFCWENNHILLARDIRKILYFEKKIKQGRFSMCWIWNFTVNSCVGLHFWFKRHPMLTFENLKKKYYF